MEVSGQNGFECDEEKALRCLLDAFGSAFSIEEIASAYCKASRNADLAVEILSDMQRSSSTSTTNLSNGDAGFEECRESSDGFSLENSCQQREYSRVLKPKFHPVSVGTVSSRLGKDYIRSKPSVNGSYYGTTKPMKLDETVLPMSEIWGDESKPNISKHDHLHQDMEDFLFKMLGHGFQLGRDKIREVLDNCGYDMQKSMEKLIDESILTSDKRARVVGDSSKRSTGMKPKSKLPSSERNSQDVNYAKGNRSRVSNKGVDLQWRKKERDDLQKEILTSLFHVPEHTEESPKRIVKDVKRVLPYGQVVNETPEDSLEEFKIDTNYSQQENIHDPEDEVDYQNLRKAVKENRATMIEYYKAAVEAFAKGNPVKADKLLDQGQFSLTKADEADEESSKMIVESKNEEAQEMLLDLQDHGSKKAIRLLECHLSSLSGIPSMYLKVIIAANNQDVSKGSRKKRIIIELLEEESIEWSEGESVGTILIRMDKIDRKRLSFLKK